MRTLVIVEDILSACSVSRVCDAMPLLGTSLCTKHINYINNNKYDRILIALDPDATIKALEMQLELQSGILKTTPKIEVLMLEDDLKYYNDKESLNEYING